MNIYISSFSSTKVTNPAGAPSYHNNSPSASVNGNSTVSIEPSVIESSKAGPKSPNLSPISDAAICSTTFINSSVGANSSPSSEPSEHCSVPSFTYSTGILADISTQVNLLSLVKPTSSEPSAQF